MELPDFMSYSDKFSPKGFVDKISKIAKRAGSKLVFAALVLFYTLQSKNVPVKDKAMIIGALGYLISPLDVLPDAIPIVGLRETFQRMSRRKPRRNFRNGSMRMNLWKWTSS